MVLWYAWVESQKHTRVIFFFEMELTNLTEGERREKLARTALYGTQGQVEF